MKRAPITRQQLRLLLKEAFQAGFDAARLGDAMDAWEKASIRIDIDHHGLHERLERSAAELPKRKRS